MAPLSPSQRARKVFPAWRRKKGLINASDEELEGESDRFERWAFGCAGILIVGLLAELALAYCDPPHESTWGRWGSVWATVLVVAGVWGEVAFARMGARRSAELARRSSERLALANAKLAEALLELERLKAPRSFTDDQMVALIEALKPFAGQEFEVTTFRDAKEPSAFTREVYAVLTMADWKFIPSPRLSFPFPGTEGVLVWIKPTAAASTKRAGEALVASLLSAAVATELREVTHTGWKTTETNQIEVTVGNKPL